MLYEELERLTNYQCTYDQYETIEKIYNECESMTKQDAAKIWKSTYGKELKIRDKKRQSIENQLIDERHLGFSERSESVRNSIFKAEEEIRREIQNYKNEKFIDSLGIEWRVKAFARTPNHCHTIYSLGIIHEGNFELINYNFFW